MRRFAIALLAAALAGVTWSCVTASPVAEGRDASSPNDRESASVLDPNRRRRTCDTICATADRCAQQDAPAPRRILDACEAGCAELRGRPTPLEARVFDCASLDDCTGFQACALAVFQPEAGRSCAASCRALADCRGQASASCLRDCETHRADRGAATLPPARPCSAQSTCDALERCMVTWTHGAEARTVMAAPSVASPHPSACRELCTRSVRCAGEAAELAATETARVIALMDQGLVSCVLDCEANAGGEKTAELRACARSPSCEKFGECVHQF